MDFHLSEGNQICGDQLSWEIRGQTGLDLGMEIDCMITYQPTGHLVHMPDDQIEGYEDEITAIVTAHDFNPDWELLAMPLDDLKAHAIEQVRELDPVYQTAIMSATTNQQVVDILNSI